MGTRKYRECLTFAFVGPYAEALSVILANRVISGLANHPFFFAIRDDRTGLILFMGWVADPTEGLSPSH